MNKIPCDVIKDLIILYEDDSCSEESKKIVEEHIRGCSGCQEFYEEATTPLPAISSEPEANGEGEISTEEKAMKFLKKLKRHEDFKIVLILLLLLAFIAFSHTVGNYFTMTIVPASAKDVKVTELYRLKNGSIFCTLESDKTFTHTPISDIIVPEIQQMSSSGDGWYELHLDTAWWRKLTNAAKSNTASFVLPLKDTFSYNDSSNIPLVRESSTIYYVGKSKNDRLTIWKNGQEIKDAPDSIEKLVAEQYAQRSDGKDSSMEADVFYLQ